MGNICNNSARQVSVATTYDVRPDHAVKQQASASATAQTQALHPKLAELPVRAQSRVPAPASSVSLPDAATRQKSVPPQSTSSPTSSARGFEYGKQMSQQDPAHRPQSAVDVHTEVQSAWVGPSSHSPVSPTSLGHEGQMNGYPCTFSSKWSKTLKELGQEVSNNIARGVQYNGLALTIYGSKPSSYIEPYLGWEGINKFHANSPTAKIRSGLALIPAGETDFDLPMEGRGAYLINIRNCINAASENRIFLNTLFNIENHSVSDREMLDNYVIPTLRRHTAYSEENKELVAIFLGFGRSNGRYYMQHSSFDYPTMNTAFEEMNEFRNDFPAGNRFVLPGFVFSNSEETMSLLNRYAMELLKIEAAYDELLKYHYELAPDHVTATAFLNALFVEDDVVRKYLH